MKLVRTWHQRLNVVTYILIGLTIAAAAFTLVQWILTEPGSFEPLHVVVVTLLLMLSFLSNRLSRQAVEDVSVPANALPPPNRLNLSPLRQQMAQAFNLDELRALCFDLGIEYEDLAGETKQAKIISFLEYVQRRSQLLELKEVLVRKRPHLKWDKPTVLTAHDLKIREKVLHNIRSTWIEGFLKHSLHTEVLELTLSYQPEAVSRTWGVVLHQPGQEDKLLPVETPIREVFEDYGRSLLILGEPGSGKTITMLQLAQDLIREALERPSRSIPVVLNLSSWSRRRQPLDEWLVEEMLVQYQVARRVSHAWVEGHQLLYLLDGLDEVAAEHRDECIIAINMFLSQYPADIVVCSRSEDYERLSHRLNLSVAVHMQPLADEEIQRYLRQEGVALQAVRATLNMDPDLYQLAQSPLMLSIMTLAYQNVKREELKPLDSVEARRRHLFHHYVERVFERRPFSDNSRYTIKQALDWLTNLAQGMRQHNQSVFHIERLQPDWLPVDKYRGYRLLAGMFSGLIAGLIYGLSLGLFLGFIVELSNLVRFITDYLVVALINSLIVGLIVGLVAGLSVGLGNWLSAPLSNKWIRFIAGYIASGLLFSLLYGLWLSLDYGVLYYAPIFGLFGGITAYQSGIVGIETLALSRPVIRRLFNGLWQGFLLGLSVGLVYILFISGGGLFSVLAVGLVGGLLGALATMIQTREAEQISRPNQVIRSSIKNAVRASLFIGVLTGLFGWWLNRVLILEIDFPLLLLVFSLPASFLYFGGIAFIQHAALRLLLAKYNVLPRHLVSFLDNMSDHLLLRRVGGGWVFIHRYLLEYFASGMTNETN